MKKSICLALLMAACGSSGKSKSAVPVASMESIVATTEQTPTQSAPEATTCPVPAPVPTQGTNTNQPNTDAYGNWITTNWYPSDAPSLRTDLYACTSIASEKGSPAGFKAYVEVFMDKSRKYHMTVKPNATITERFVAYESAQSSSPHLPIKMEAGATQSGNVLYGMLAETKTAYGLDSGANWQINMRSSSMRGNIEMFVTVTDNNEEAPVKVPYGTCYRVGQ